MYQSLEEHLKAQVDLIQRVLLVHQKYHPDSNITLGCYVLGRYAEVSISSERIKISKTKGIIAFYKEKFDEYSEIINEYKTMPLSQFVLTHGKNPFAKALGRLKIDQLDEIISILNKTLD